MPTRAMTTATIADKTRKWESLSKRQYLTCETFSQALNKIQVMDLKEEWSGRACERGGSVDFSLLLSDPRSWTPRVSRLKIGRTVLMFLQRVATGGRNVCLLVDGCLGVFPKLAEVGDRGFAFLGAQVLYTLRPRGPSSGRHIYIGETYIHGVMDRGLMRSEKIGTARVENLVLV